MNMRRICIAGVMAAVAFNAWGAANTPKASKPKFDVTGTWHATIEGGRGPAMNLVFVLKQEGDKLSGTLSTNGSPPVEITEARVLRTTIYFEVSTTMGGMGGPGGQRGPGGPPGMGPGMPGMGMGRSMITKYTGSLSGDELKLTSQMKQQARDGDAPTGSGMPKTQMVAKRQ